MLNQAALNLFGCMAIVCTVGLSASVNAQNLVPDTAFGNFGYDPTEHQETWKERWIPHQIKAPSEWTVQADRGAVELQGGETFLHSPYFPVTSGQELSVAVTAAGDAEVSVQMLWWTADGGMVDPHRTIPVEPVKIKEDGQRVSGKDTVPEGAAQAYIRIVVQEGTARVSNPSVTVAE